jgi:hypothetical protein
LEARGTGGAHVDWYLFKFKLVKFSHLKSVGLHNPLVSTLSGMLHAPPPGLAERPTSTGGSKRIVKVRGTSIFDPTQMVLNFLDRLARTAGEHIKAEGVWCH